MTDLELLELAAKAAGIEINKAPSGKLFARFGVTEWVEWNPLENDGDALRLAVKLKMHLRIHNAIRVDFYNILDKFLPSPLYEPLEPDAYASTRRAIVRAAAEIGKGMEVTT